MKGRIYYFSKDDLSVYHSLEMAEKRIREVSEGDLPTDMWQVHIYLDSSALPFSSNSISDLYIYFRPIKSPTALITINSLERLNNKQKIKPAINITYLAHYIICHRKFRFQNRNCTEFAMIWASP